MGDEGLGAPGKGKGCCGQRSTREACFSRQCAHRTQSNNNTAASKGVKCPAHPVPLHLEGVLALGGPSDTIGCELGCLGLNPESPVSSLTWTSYSVSPGLSFYI